MLMLEMMSSRVEREIIEGSRGVNCDFAMFSFDYEPALLKE
jgi:hypothetical protein